MHRQAWKGRSANAVTCLFATVLVALLLPACELKAPPGVVTLQLSLDEPQEGPLYLWIEVQERNEALSPGPVLAAVGPELLSPGEPTRWKLPQVPNGSKRVVVVEARETANPNTTVRYYGVSKPFEIRSGDQVTVAVPIRLSAPESALAQVTKPLIIDTPEGPIGPELATALPLVMHSLGAVRIDMANDPGFAASKRSFDLSSAPELTCEALADPEGKTIDECRLVWDLLSGDSSLDSGLRTVYVRFVDRYGYASQTASASRYVDLDGPLPVAAGLSPAALVPCNSDVTLTIDFHESLSNDSPITPPKVIPSTTQLSDFVLAAADAKNQHLTFQATTACTGEADLDTLHFAISTVDQFGNGRIDAPLLAPSGEPLTLTVDGQPPQAPLLTLTADSKLESSQNVPLVAAHSGATLDLSFVVEDNDAVAVESAGARLLMAKPLDFEMTPCQAVEDHAGTWFCHGTLTLPDDAAHGTWSVAAEISDMAGNRVPVAPEVPAAVTVDGAPPQAVCTVMPPPSAGGFAIGDTFELRIQPLEALLETAPPELVLSLLEGELTIALENYFVPVPGAPLWHRHTVSEGEGEYVLQTQVRLTDQVGNATTAGATACLTPESSQVTVDGMAPVISNLWLAGDATGPLDAPDILGAGSVILAGFTLQGTDLAPTHIQLNGVELTCDEEGSTWSCAHALGGLENEGVAQLEVSGADEAGNSFHAALEEPFVAIDFTPPFATCQSSTQLAKAGDRVRIKGLFSEPIAPATVVFETQPDWPFEQEASSGEDAGVVYGWTVPVDAEPGTVSYTLWAQDLAGNPQDGALLCQGEFAFDGTPVTILEKSLVVQEMVNGNWQTKSGPHSSRAHPGDAIDVTVVLSEPVATSPLLRVGTADISDTLETDDSVTFLAHHVLVADDHDNTAVLPVAITVADEAGNLTTEPLGVPVLFDAIAPAQAQLALFQRCDDFSNARIADNELWVSMLPDCQFEPTATGACIPPDGLHGQVRLSALVTEELQPGQTTVTVGGETTLVTPCTPAGTIEALFTPTGLEPEQECQSVLATVHDLAGNEALLELGCLRFDFTPPPAPDTTLPGGLVHGRAPWGTLQSPGIPQFTLWAAPGSFEFGTTILALDQSTQASATLVGTLPVNPDGGLSASNSLLEGVPLLPVDRPALFLLVQDRAGNLSDQDNTPENGVQATQVMDTEWVAVPPPDSAATATTRWLSTTAMDPSPQAVESIIWGPDLAAGVTTEAAALRTSRRPEAGISPEARSNNALAQGPDGTVLLFGGKLFSGVRLQDTWVWRSGGWYPQTPDVNPARRDGHAMAFDAMRNRTVLFGGNSVLGLLWDTWEWDGQQWLERTPDDPSNDGAPHPRAGHAMQYYDGRVHLFGGGSQGGLENDHWFYDGADWVRRPPELGESFPPPRTGHGLAGTTDGLYLFGGCLDSFASGCANYDGTLWRFQGNDWQQISPADPEGDGNPEARANAYLFASGLDGTFVIAGGMGTDGAFGDAWHWTGSSWEQLGEGEAVLPWALHSGSGAWSSALGGPLLMGGLKGSIPIDGTYGLHNTAWVGPLGLDGDGSGDPGLRIDHALAGRPLEPTVWLYGGHNFGLTDQSPEVWGDLWRLEGGDWQPVATVDELHDFDPVARYATGLAPTPDDKLLLVGGKDATHTLVRDAWLLDGNEWQALCDAASCPFPALASHSLVLDSLRGVIVLTGGTTPDGLHSATWEWTDGNWSKVNISDPEGDSNPSPRYHAAASFSAQEAGVLLFGGTTANGPSDEFWRFDGQSWERLEGTDGLRPPALSQATLSCSDTLTGCVLVGGSKGSKVSATVWHWNGQRWRLLDPLEMPGSPALPPMARHAAAAHAGGILLFGGAGNDGPPQSTWSLFRDNSQAAHLFQVRFNGASPPEAATVLGVESRWLIGSAEYGQPSATGSAIDLFWGNHYAQMTPVKPHNAPPDSTASLEWRCSNPAWLERGTNGFFSLEDQWLSVMTHPAASPGVQPGRHVTEGAEIRVRYRHEPLVHYGFDGWDRDGWIAAKEDWGESPGSFRSFAGQKTHFTSPFSSRPAAEMTALWLRYRVDCGPVDLALRWRVEFAPGFVSEFSDQAKLALSLNADGEFHTLTMPLTHPAWVGKTIAQLQLVTQGAGPDCDEASVAIDTLLFYGEPGGQE